MATSPVTQHPSLEDKILAATQEAEKAVAIFSPQVAEIVSLGVAIEPIISGFAKMIIGLFHHHVGVTPPQKTN